MSKELFSVYHCKACNKIEVSQYISKEEMEEGRNNLAAHDNRNVDEKKILLYEQIIRVV